MRVPAGCLCRYRRARLRSASLVVGSVGSSDCWTGALDRHLFWLILLTFPPTERLPQLLTPHGCSSFTTFVNRWENKCMTSCAKEPRIMHENTVQQRPHFIWLYGGSALGNEDCCWLWGSLALGSKGSKVTVGTVGAVDRCCNVALVYWKVLNIAIIAMRDRFCYMYFFWIYLLIILFLYDMCLGPLKKLCHWGPLAALGKEFGV
jgi:hypothetical protein